MLITTLQLFAVTLLFYGSPAASVKEACGNFCSASNCQVNNVDLLEKLIESKINQSLANEPGKITPLQ
jgi:hypothetical protein